MIYVVKVQGLSLVCDSYKEDSCRNPVSFGDGFPEDEPTVRHCELSLDVHADSAEAAVKRVNEVVQKLLSDEIDGNILREPPYDSYA